MVRHGIRGAVIALVCGSAVATAMGVLMKSNASGGYRSNSADVSQRLRYEYGQTASLVPRVATIPGETQGISGAVPLPAFMTGDTSRPVGASPAALAALDATHATAKAPKATSLETSPLAAAARGGSAGGYAYGYSSKLAKQTSLDADLAEYATEARRPRLGSDAPFSASNAPRGATSSGVSVADLTGTTGDTTTNPETNPGEVNSTLPSTAQSNAGANSPATPIVRDQVNQQVASASGNGDFTPPSNAAATPVPAPGAATILGLGGVALLRRRR
jgi:MYXO-CTERM domain-containing protein